MSKIYYNVKQFKNALATGLLGLATLGPMTSCEKNEPDIDKGKIETTNNKNKGSEEKDKQPLINYGDVSKNNFVYGELEKVTGKTYRYFYEGDSTVRADQKIVNNYGTFLNCSIITNEGKTYEIDFIKNDKGDLELYDYFPNKENTLDIFNKYRIEDKYYTGRGFNPPVLPLKIDNL